MKLSDFILLNEEQKKRAVLHDGVLLCKRQLPATVIFLFHVQHFYVEVWFDANSKEVKVFHMFVETEMLQPYLEDISISELMK